MEEKMLIRDDAKDRNRRGKGRIGWLSVPEWGRSFLVRESEEGWTNGSDDAPNEWFARENLPAAIFTPLTPADFGWTVLGEGQVVVDREDLEWMRPREMSYADIDDFLTARNRLIAALGKEADDDVR